MAEQELQVEKAAGTSSEDDAGHMEDTEDQAGEVIDQMAEIKKDNDDFKLFGLWDVSDIKTVDPGMKRYINLEPKLMVKSHGRIREKFGRAKVNLLEIFANLVAVPGHRGKKHKIQTGWKTGKYSQNMMIVVNTLKIIEEKMKMNPVQVFVTALENAAPMDGVTIIEYGGARYPQAVDISPLRRVTMTIRVMVQGSYDKSFNKKTKIEQALSNEIMKAYNKDMDSGSMSKKRDGEKQADSAR
jgi:small subunit ribosomal protein S7